MNFKAPTDNYLRSYSQTCDSENKEEDSSHNYELLSLNLANPLNDSVIIRGRVLCVAYSRVKEDVKRRRY